MSKHNIIKFDPAVPAKFADWFGAPAVLTDEELQIYNKMLCGVYHDVKPQDFIELSLVEDYAYNLFRRLRSRRRQANVRRQVHNEKFERQERELLQDAERRKQEVRRLYDVYGPTRHHSGGRNPLIDEKFAIELEINERRMKKQLAEIDAETNEKLAKLQKTKEAPIDEAAYFDQWIDKEERINEELAQVDQNIRITLKLLDEHRTGLGQRLRQVTDEIVDVEFAEIPASSGESVAEADALANTEVKEESTGAMMAPTLAELPASASAKTNGGALTKLDAPATLAPPPSSGPAEQR
jgi:hypothetical protein